MSSNCFWTNGSTLGPRVKTAFPPIPFIFAPIDCKNETMLSGFVLDARGTSESKYKLAPLDRCGGRDDEIFMPSVVKSPTDATENFSVDSCPASAEYPSTNVNSPFCS